MLQVQQHVCWAWCWMCCEAHSLRQALRGCLAAHQSTLDNARPGIAEHTDQAQAGCFRCMPACVRKAAPLGSLMQCCRQSIAAPLQLRTQRLQLCSGAASMCGMS